MPNQNLDRLFHALADKTRRAVVHRLSQGPATVSELAAPHKMALPSFMQHLEVLKRCGLMRSVKRGRVRVCTIERERLIEAEGWIIEQKALWEGRLDRLDAYLQELQEAENGENK